MRIPKAFLLALLIVMVGGVIGAAVLILRGFRATATPSSLEVALATTARNLAIPREERGHKNPFAPSSDNTQQGRAYFLNRCAACHGPDGSGKTQIGLNLYPRVPDLRATAAQNLTDGELHLHHRKWSPTHGHACLGQSALGSNGRRLETGSFHSQSALAY